jgi:hypothetical protein
MRKREHMAAQTNYGCRPGWALLAVAGTAVGQLLGCSAHPVETEREIEPSVITLALPESLGDARRPAVEFDHASHTAALENEGCAACHRSEREGELVFDLERSVKREDDEALMNYYHDSCMGCHKRRAGRNQRTGPVTCGDCHLEQAAGRSARDPMRFDYSLHGRHSQAESDKCERCHHVYNEEKKALEYKKGAESACADCHGERDEGNNLSLANASHQACVNCHIERAGEGEKSGPETCVGCHDASEKEKIEKLAEIPRIERDQPKAVWIDGEGGMSGKVAFDHFSHEPLAASCSSCHHRTLDACRECHTLRGSAKGGNVTSEGAYHAAHSEHSCVGCHARETAGAKCAGCHHTLEPPPAESACRTCHSEPVPPPIMSSAPAEQLAMSVAGSSAPAPQPPKSAPPVFTEVQLTPLPAYSDDFPESVTIEAIAAEYEPSILPHGKIVAALDRSIRESKLAKRFHGQTEVLCSGCHHQTPVGVRPTACGSCHADESHPTLDKPALKAAYHLQCIECHEKIGIDKQGCTDCHDKASGEVAQ